MSDTPTQLAVRPAASPGQLVPVVVEPATKDTPVVVGLAKVTDKGTIRSIRTSITLDTRKGHVWQMPAGDKPFALTALAYDVLNRVAGIALLTPPTLHIDDGRTVPNPYFERVAETDEIKRVSVRMVGIGRSSVGNLVAHDVTLCYDLGNYLAQDIWSKWTGYGDNAPKGWGRAFPFAHVPDEFKANPKYLRVAIPGGLALYVDLGIKEVLTVFKEHISRQKFAERLAVTICRRNVLARFFAVRKVQPAENGTFEVTVVAWPEADHGLETVADMASQAQEGRIVIDNEVVEVASAVVTPEKDDIDAALADDTGEDDAPPDDESAEPAPASVAPQAPPPDKIQQDKLNVLRVEIRQLIVQLSPDQQQAACQAANVPGPTALGQVEDQATLIAVRAQLMQRGARPKNKQRTQTPAQEPKQEAAPESELQLGG